MCLFTESVHGVYGLKNYHKPIAENKDVAKYVMMMSSAAASLKADVVGALMRYSDYAFLWEKDRQEAVQVCNLSPSLVFLDNDM